MLQACFDNLASRCSSSAKTIVVSELKSTLRNSSGLSASSRRSESRLENPQSGAVYRTTILVESTSLGATNY